MNTLLDDICNLVRMIAARDHKTWGQAIEEITESLKEDMGGFYDKFELRTQLLDAIIKEFNCSRVLANRYTTQYELENGIECKRGRSIAEGLKKRKERFDFIEKNLMYTDAEIVKLLMSKFSIGRSASYQLLKQYKKNRADKFREITECVYENTKRKKNKMYIDDSSYFENSFKWSPKGGIE